MPTAHASDAESGSSVGRRSSNAALMQHWLCHVSRGSCESAHVQGPADMRPSHLLLWRFQGGIVAKSFA
eukprot:5715637-Prymnesium_polylepis.2